MVQREPGGRRSVGWRFDIRAMHFIPAKSGQHSSVTLRAPKRQPGGFALIPGGALHCNAMLDSPPPAR
ncbi:hypothetical protein SAMN04488245_103306 [Alloyangia pacifica]|uniref:Uncharacterized protein n=1 Tax=Alloyangia pacifica TaxID=311180 RepID=A0A1I6RS64_9RHOB|nr:hypothetical protein SAMN04488245_103306 [Alloyangia pacifica]SFS67573.1 hypothetical protein SAMN04488050_103350 [Alloyangia pacifica]